MNDIKDIYKYMDYRVFLNDLIKFKSENNPNFSIRLFASKIGCDSSFLVKVLNGKKNISTRLVIKIAEYLNFNPSETLFLELLVQFKKSKSSKERLKIEEQLEFLAPSIKE